jgi:hypothetical protein
MIAIKKCPYCGDAWLYVTKEDKYKINCLCGFAYKKTPECADSELAKSVWNGIVNAEKEKMADMMQFPETWEEFEKQYGFTDEEHVYTNGARLIPSFRVEQWLEHNTNRLKLVQDSVHTIMNIAKTDSIKDKCFRNAARLVQMAIDGKYQDFEPIPEAKE